MKLKTLFVVLLSAASAIFCSLAVSAENKSPLDTFIDGDLPLEPHPDFSKVYRYIAPEMDLKRYDRVMFEPIEIWLHEQSEYKGFDAEVMKALTDRFLQVMQQELEPDYPVVSKPGAGVAVVRIAISGVKLRKKKRGLLGYTPVGFIATSVMDAAGKRLSLIAGTIEAELLDGASAERIAVVVDFSFKESDEPSSWSDMEARMRLYAKRLRHLLDHAHGREPKQYTDVPPSFLHE